MFVAAAFIADARTACAAAIRALLAGMLCGTRAALKLTWEIATVSAFQHSLRTVAQIHTVLAYTANARG